MTDGIWTRKYESKHTRRWCLIASTAKEEKMSSEYNNQNISTHDICKKKKIRHPGGVNEQRKNFYGTHLQEEDERKKENHMHSHVCAFMILSYIHFFVYKKEKTYNLHTFAWFTHSLVVHSLAQLTQGYKRLKIWAQIWLMRTYLNVFQC